MKESARLGAERNGAPETESSVRSGGERLGAARPPATEAGMGKEMMMLGAERRRAIVEAMDGLDWGFRLSEFVHFTVFCILRS